MFQVRGNFIYYFTEIQLILRIDIQFYFLNVMYPCYMMFSFEITKPFLLYVKAIYVEFSVFNFLSRSFAR